MPRPCEHVLGDPAADQGSAPAGVTCMPAGVTSAGLSRKPGVGICMHGAGGHVASEDIRSALSLMVPLDQ